MEEITNIKISELCTKVCSGGTPKSSVPSYYDGNIPWLNTKEINFNRIYSTEKSITEDGLNNSSAKWIDKNAVIVAMYGATAGKTAISKIPLTTNQACCNLMIDADKADYRFVYYALVSEYNRLASLANGGAQQNLNAQQIKDFEIPFFSLKDQKRIATILSTLDDKIELNRRINDNLELQAQALFAEIFESDYTFAQLGAVIETCSGGTPSRNNLDYYIDGTICWVKSKELNRSFLFDTEEKIAQVGIDKSSAKLLPKNSVLIAMYGATVGEYCIIDKPMTCNQAICALLPSSNYPASYLYMFVKQKRNELINLAVGSAQQNISQVLIKGLSVSANLKLIAKFDKMVMPIFNMIRKNAKESIILEAERNTLLPRLMSGELKINDLNC